MGAYLPYATEVARTATKYCDAYTVVLNAEMRARQGAGAPPMGAYLPYVTEVARTATKYCDAYMRLKN